MARHPYEEPRPKKKDPWLLVLGAFILFLTALLVSWAISIDNRKPGSGDVSIASSTLHSIHYSQQMNKTRDFDGNGVSDFARHLDELEGIPWYSLTDQLKKATGYEFTIIPEIDVNGNPLPFTHGYAVEATPLDDTPFLYIDSSGIVQTSMTGPVLGPQNPQAPPTVAVPTPATPAVPSVPATKAVESALGESK